MASNLERWEKNLERLERFFKKRKRSSPPSPRRSLTVPTSSSAPADLPIQNTQFTQTPHQEAEIVKFPSPSFLRPKASRMVARDEVTVALESNRGARSLPGPLSQPERFSVASSADITTSSYSTYSRLLDQFPRIPHRTSSLRTTSIRHSKLTEGSLCELHNFSFPNKRISFDGPVWSLASKPRSSISHRRTASATHGRELNLHRLPEGVTMQAQRPETPPPSAKESHFPPSTPPGIEEVISKITDFGNPTPEPSPRLTPSSMPGTTSSFESPVLPRELQVRRLKSFESPRTLPKSSGSSLRKTASDGILVRTKFPVLAEPAPEEPVLRAPSWTEFLALSDEDIADGRPITPEPESSRSTPPHVGTSPPSRPTSIPPSPHTSRGPLLALSAPLTTRPAAAAAFEAARIAKAYDFDLLYVVNLWPSDIASGPPQSLFNQNTPLPTSQSPSSPMKSLPPTPISPSCVSPGHGLAGRLLAAYGLQNVASPFRISAAVLMKVLRHYGWLEFRKASPAPNEFARGFSCAFYPDYDSTYHCGPESLGGLSKDKRRSIEYANKGIIFAAYKLPSADGSVTGMDTAELERLRCDASALVELLVHGDRVTQKQQQSISRDRLSMMGGENKTISQAPLLAAQN